MFDSYNGGNSIKINAVTGTITKNYAKSFFLRFHLKSKLADDLLCGSPVYRDRDGLRKVVMLQMMICGDMEVVAELMWKDDFDELFERSEECQENTGNLI